LKLHDFGIEFRFGTPVVISSAALALRSLEYWRREGRYEEEEASSKDTTQRDQLLRKMKARWKERT
jgi:hypothetical protein